MNPTKQVSVCLLVLWVCTFCTYALFELKVNCTAVKDTCRPCPYGEFADKDNEYCECCDVGSCPEHNNMSYCTDCPSGTFMNSTNATHCIPCQAGTVAPHKGSVNCTNCQRGYFQHNVGKSECRPCSVGTHCNVSGCTSCEGCPAGQEACKEASINCTLCKPGTYKAYLGPTLCRTCMHGYFATGFGQTHCAECPKYYYCPLPDEGPRKCSTQAVCPPGSTAPQYCWAPWYYTPDNLHCVLSRDFKVIVSAVSIAFVLLVVIVVVCCVYEKRCRAIKACGETEKLLHAAKEEIKNEPKYTGL